jgi:hypothetical protein
MCCAHNREAIARHVAASSLAYGVGGDGVSLLIAALLKPHYEENIIDAMEKSSYSYFSLGAQESI